MSFQQRRFGATGLTLPCLSVGTAAVGRPAYLNLGHAADIPDASVDGMRTLTHDLLDVAYRVGVRHVDTARSYGLAEDFVSSWLEQREYPDVVVTSKWGYRYVGDWKIGNLAHEVKDLSVEAFFEQSRETLARFGAKLTGYQIHSATVESGVLQDRRVLDAMTALTDSGLLIGVSTSGPSQSATIREVLALVESGRTPFSFVQSTWNVLEPSAAGALREAADTGLGVIVKEALANGRLVKGPEVPVLVLQLAAKYGVRPDAICLAAAMALDCAPVVLSGPVTVDQFLENAKATLFQLTEAELSELAGLQVDPRNYWATRTALPWT